MCAGYDRLQELVSTAEGELVPAMLYVWPAARAHQIDIERQWSYAEFREVSLEAFVRDVVVPCAAEFEEEEPALRLLHEST